MIEKVCNGCKKVLPIESYGINRATKDGYQRKCKECVKAIDSNRYTLECKQCGSKFGSLSKNKMYCSNKCSGMSQRKRAMVNCAICSTEMEVQAYKLNCQESFCCSDKCRSAHKSATSKGELNPNFNSVKSPCHECGKDILVNPSRLSKHKYCYCSKKCMY